MRSSSQPISLLAATLLAAAAAHAPAKAQEPDLREIMPYVMLVIDTSGSMERVPECTCMSAGCEECLPQCELPNVDGEPPTEPPNDPDGRPLKKNRWATALEALTGSFNDFQCTKLDRLAENGATYDVGYFVPYYQPWHCPTVGEACLFDDVPAEYQSQNGMLDTYASRLRFGLMTFDGMDTYVGATSLVEATAFDVDRSKAVHGLWSYGGPKTFNYPGCDTDYMMDTGARGPQAVEGSLISLNSCTGGGTPGNSETCPGWCTTCTGDDAAINRDIQEALLSTRPYGGTPIAASLDDLYEHLQVDVAGDLFGSCRHRYAVLVTDGEPDDDYRNDGCDCDKASTAPDRCGGFPDPVTGLYHPKWDPARKHCPYPTAEEAARYLVSGNPEEGTPPMIERLFVVGMALDANSPNVLASLNRIADEGCLDTPEECDKDGDGNIAIFADDLPTLVQNLDQIFSGLFQAISRTVPAFAVPRQVAGNTVTNQIDEETIEELVPMQYQLSTGFEIASETGAPWTGILERRRFVCNGAELVETPLDEGRNDKFDKVLNSGIPEERRLLTIMPPGASDGWGSMLSSMNGHIYEGSPFTCDSNGCETLLSTTLHPSNFGLPADDTARAAEIVNWMLGEDPRRAQRKLGDIYHSSPVPVGAPRFDTADEAFNQFRLDVAARPLVVYVGSNDGILHAFSVEEYEPPSGYPSGRALRAGEEIWGFVPPLLLDDLEENLNRHMFSMDGTPVVKNVYFDRDNAAEADPNDYHTVLITGMRGGGNAYIALDVTNPFEPRFLWQFTDPQMGKTFAQAAIVQARYKVDTGTGTETRQGAVAILPGGVGEPGGSGECTNNVTQSMRMSGDVPFETFPEFDLDEGDPFQHRSEVRCWRHTGRALYFIEVASGKLLKKIYLDPANNDEPFFPSPLVGAPAVYPAEPGVLTQQAYLVDADGVIWRIDLTAEDQLDDTSPQGMGTDARPREGWTARPFHDIFHGTGPTLGELTYEAPVLSVDADGRVVVIVGTGDTNNYVKPFVHNRVVSLTEVVDTGVSAASPERFKAVLNWQMGVTGATTGTRLVPSELVTGSMALFNGTLFFGTFMAVTGSNACDLGKGRVHAVHYNARGPANPDNDTYAPLLMDVDLGDDSALVMNVEPEDAQDNMMLMGMVLTRRPACLQQVTGEFNVWGDPFWGPTDLTPPSMYLVAHGSGGSDLLQRRGGSALSSAELQVNTPESLSRVISWATSTE